MHPTGGGETDCVLRYQGRSIQVLNLQPEPHGAWQRS